jgi:hypothetical protein
LSGSSPLTCLAWEVLPVSYTTASIALGFTWPHKPHHYVKVGILSGGVLILTPSNMDTAYMDIQFGYHTESYTMASSTVTLLRGQKGRWPTKISSIFTPRAHQSISQLYCIPKAICRYQKTKSNNLLNSNFYLFNNNNN